MNREEAAKALGHVPSGLFIVVARDKREEKIDGYLASWVQQVSFDPLLISLAIKPGRPAYDLIKEGIPFSVNIVGDHDKQYMKHFWSGYDPEKRPFDEIPHDLTEKGSVKIKAAKSVLECQLKEVSKPGDHELIIAEVIGSYINHEESKSMVHIRKSGLDY